MHNLCIEPHSGLFISVVRGVGGVVKTKKSSEKYGNTFGEFKALSYKGLYVLFLGCYSKYYNIFSSP